MKKERSLISYAKCPIKEIAFKQYIFSVRFFWGVRVF